jgi:hypothetical protein
MSISGYSVSGQFPSTVGGVNSGTLGGPPPVRDSSGKLQTRKFFPNLLGGSIGKLPAAPTESNASGQLAVPGSNTLNGRWFAVLVGGTFGNDTGDPSQTVQIDLFANTNTAIGSGNTAPNYISLGSTGALTPSPLGIVNSWALKFDFFGDSNSGLVIGAYKAIVAGSLANGTPAATVALSNINFGSPIPFGLVVGVTFGTSDASNTASLMQFELGKI